MDYFYNLGALIILISWSLTNNFAMRFTAIVGYLVLLQYSAVNDLYLALFWIVLYILANLIRIILSLKDLIPRDLSPELQQIKQQLFQNMPIGEFIRLMALSHRAKASDQRILTEGESVKYLMLITAGTMYIKIANATVELGPYHFIGEMSYFNEGIANNTVFVKEPAEYLYWDYEDLYNLQKKHSNLFMRLVEAMGKKI